jgi:hypothetical protein
VLSAESYFFGRKEVRGGTGFYDAIALNCANKGQIRLLGRKGVNMTPEQLARPDNESSQQIAFFAWAALAVHERPDYGCLTSMFAIPNGGKRDKREAGRLKAEGARAGVWDIFLPEPRYPYCGLFLEMKVGSNKLTAEQENFKKKLAPRYAFAIAYTWEEARDHVKQYLSR